MHGKPQTKNENEPSHSDQDSLHSSLASLAPLPVLKKLTIEANKDSEAVLLYRSDKDFDEKSIRSVRDKSSVKHSIGSEGSESEKRRVTFSGSKQDIFGSKAHKDVKIENETSKEHAKEDLKIENKTKEPAKEDLKIENKTNQPKENTKVENKISKVEHPKENTKVENKTNKEHTKEPAKVENKPATPSTSRKKS